MKTGFRWSLINLPLLAAALLGAAGGAHATGYGWKYVTGYGAGNVPIWSPDYPSIMAACMAYLPQGQVIVTGLRQPVTYVKTGVSSAECRGVFPPWYPNGGFAFLEIIRDGGSCPDGQIYNSALGNCEDPGSLVPRKMEGFPDDSMTCNAPSNAQGNPVNAATGNKFQLEEDYAPLKAGAVSFTRYYNGVDGLWRSNYSTGLTFPDSSTVYLTKNDGRASQFKLSGTSYVAETTELGRLSSAGQVWTYVDSENSTYTFDAQGRLTGIRFPSGLAQSLVYGITSVTVTDAFGGQLIFAVGPANQPASFSSAGLVVSYAYTDLNGFRLLTGATYSQGAKQWSRQYLYEDTAYPAALTGITDERGVRYATWHYDAQGRAISSEHANGAEKVTLTYNDDGSTTVTNALGHAVTYRYQVIQGIKHITSIEGEPAAGCPASNSSYTYNTIGQVATKTDALGHITAYTYDTLGRETQRVEAQGTAQARTTTTTWHGTSFLPETVTTADRVTTYTYDTQNRLLSTSTHATQGSVP
ncbi:DUF6531 domain-containing protein [Dyella sp. GSA-30]|uniref:DUF6531 domain-containing protein n=1 Tax=Dyella sp. GSA-30 TaxID=2994496 RepID=UPI002490F2D1|nr:DUF6531 domain-containing protein [Dyella sp. GSA-30]